MVGLVITITQISYGLGLLLLVPLGYLLNRRGLIIGQASPVLQPEPNLPRAARSAQQADRRLHDLLFGGLCHGVSCVGSRLRPSWLDWCLRRRGDGLRPTLIAARCALDVKPATRGVDAVSILCQQSKLERSCTQLTQGKSMSQTSDRFLSTRARFSPVNLGVCV